ncbi:carbohydrate kinase [Cellulosimicrobium terreum]|nr:carbohydrate kinase [Cellulosimicrobium terreum]
MLVCCGLVTLDVVQVVDRLPAPDEKVVARSVSATFGGPAANAAATAVALGTPTRLVAAVGSGQLAAMVRAELTDAGVELVDVAAGTDGQPAVSTVLVTWATGERAVASTNALGFGSATPDREALPVPGQGDVLLLDGHLPQVALPLAGAARDRGALVVLDGGSWKESTPDVLALCDAVVLSADFRVPGSDDAEVLDAVAALGPGGRLPFVARTSGPGPVDVLRAGERTSIAVPRAARVVDTLGAGDVVHGAFAAWLERGASPSVALERAVEVATRSVEHTGARGWIDAPPQR